MFEQSLYGQEPIEEPAPIVQDGDLFQNYELRSWVPSPRLYKILGASALANLLALLVVAQTSLLTMKGCDSPLVGSVCQVLDTVYMGTMLLGTEREYADAAYERTELGDMDITYVELPSENSKLQYPEGYFELANPEQFVASDTTTGDVPFPTTIPTYPGIPTTRPIPGNNLLNTPPVYAKPNLDVVNGKLPSSLDDKSTAGDPTTSKKPKKGANTPSNMPLKNDDGTVAGIPGTANSNTNTGANTAQTDKKDEGSADQNGIFLNKRPLKDKATETLAKLDQGTVSLDKAFRVVITGTLGLAKDGKTIVLKNPKVAPPDKNFPADPALTKLAQEWIVAVGDAGWYGYLGLMDEKKGVGQRVAITIEQNDTTFLASVKAEQPTPERANKTASSLYNLMTLGAAFVGGNSDEITFLKSTKTTSDGNFLVVNFEMPKPQVQEMIQRKLAAEKAAPKQPNGTAVVPPQSNVG